MKDKSLKEIIISADDNRSVLIEEWNRLSLLLENVKKVNKLCSTMIEVRLHRVDKAIDKLGQRIIHILGWRIINNLIFI